MEENKSWYAVLTADVLYSEKLNSTQKLMYAVIANMSNHKGYCFASNTFFAEMFKCSVRSIQLNLDILENEGFIGRVLKLKDNGEIEYRALTPCNIIHEGVKKTSPTPMKKTSSPHEENFTIITNNNNIYNNNKYTFDEFWDMYDKKIGDKNKLSKKYDKLDMSEKELIFAHVPKYKLSQPDKKYRKNPETYINNKSWNDEIVGVKETVIQDKPKTYNEQW
jgi:hypothetical protein